MQNLIDAIRSLKAAEQSLLQIGGERACIEADSIRLSIQNLEREAQKALDKNG